MKLSNRQYLKHFIIFVAIISLLVLGMISPFLPGEFDPLAMPLSLMIQVFGVAGLLLTIAGVFWLLMPRQENVFVSISLIMGKLVILILAMVATFSSGKVLGIAIVTAGIFLFFRLKTKHKLLKTADRCCHNPLPLYLIVLPVLTLVLQLVLIKPVKHWSRERAINNADEFIRKIENFHTTYGHYPVTLHAMYSDYKPDAAGIEKYHYSPQGNAYNLSFEQPRFLLDDIGSREWVVYNPVDEHRAFSHTSWFLELSPLDVERYQGWYETGDTGHPHWKYFLFD